MELDLDAYFDRIGYHGVAAPTFAHLREVHLAHALSIPFENVDVLLGLPIRLDLHSLQDKLVARRRGGYCFEQNMLFAAVLEAIGFPVTRLAARVRFGRRLVAPRTHMLLGVEAGGTRWLCDVGFGGSGIVEPIPLEPGPPVDQFGWGYRLIPDAAENVLQSREAGGWVDQYAFTLEPQHPVDHEVANHYTSTHPDSPFTRTLTAQRPAPDDPAVRMVLRGRKLSEHRPDGHATSERVADEDLVELLADRFGIMLPAGTRLP